MSVTLLSGLYQSKGKRKSKKHYRTMQPCSHTVNLAKKTIERNKRILLTLLFWHFEHKWQNSESPEAKRVRSRRSDVVRHRAARTLQSSPDNHHGRVIVVVGSVKAQTVAELSHAVGHDGSRCEMCAVRACLVVHREEHLASAWHAHRRTKWTSLVCGRSTRGVVCRTDQHLSAVCVLRHGPRTQLRANVSKALLDEGDGCKVVSLWAHVAHFGDSERVAVVCGNLHCGERNGEKEGAHCCVYSLSVVWGSVCQFKAGLDTSPHAQAVTVATWQGHLVVNHEVSS